MFMPGRVISYIECNNDKLKQQARSLIYDKENKKSNKPTLFTVKNCYMVGFGVRN